MEAVIARQLPGLHHVLFANSALLLLLEFVFSLWILDTIVYHRVIVVQVRKETHELPVFLHFLANCQSLLNHNVHQTHLAWNGVKLSAQVEKQKNVEQ